MRRLRDPMSGPLKALKAHLRHIRNPYCRQVVNEGRDAAMDGHTRQDNPYPTRSEFARIWLEGFDAAMEEIQSVEKFRRLKT